MTNMRSGDFVKLCTTRHIWLVASYHKHGKKANRSNKDVLELTLKWHGLIATELFCKGEEQETQEEGEWDCLDFWRWCWSILCAVAIFAGHRLQKNAVIILAAVRSIDERPVSALLAICIADGPRIVTEGAILRFCLCLWHWFRLAGWKTKLEEDEDCPQKRKEGWCRPHSRLNLVPSNSAS